MPVRDCVLTEDQVAYLTEEWPWTWEGELIPGDLVTAVSCARSLVDQRDGKDTLEIAIIGLRGENPVPRRLAQADCRSRADVMQVLDAIYVNVV